MIIKSACYQTFLDLKGEYGIITYSAAIVDTPETLKMIQKTLDTPEFRYLTARFVGDKEPGPIIDRRGQMFKFLKLFKRDFWKEFV